MQLDSEEQQHALELRFREFLETSRRDAWTFAVFGTLGAALFLVLAYLLFLVLVGRLAPFAAAGIQLLCAAALFLVYTVFGIYRTRNYWKNHETEDPDLLAAGPWIHGYWRVSFEPDLIILVFVAYSANFLTFPFYLLSQSLSLPSTSIDDESIRVAVLILRWSSPSTRLHEIPTLEEIGRPTIAEAISVLNDLRLVRIRREKNDDSGSFRTLKVSRTFRGDELFENE